MTELVETLRGKVASSCIKRRLQKKGCCVSLRDAPQSRLIIDFDEPGSPLGLDQTRCDYLFVAEKHNGPRWVMPLELKSGGVKATQVIEQLQAGAAAAEQIVPSHPMLRFCPVLVSGGIHKADRTAMKKHRIRFGQHCEPVRLIRCGAALIEAFGS